MCVTFAGMEKGKRRANWEFPCQSHASMIWKQNTISFCCVFRLPFAAGLALRAPGGTRSILDGRVRRSFILQTQKNTQARNFGPKKIPSIKVSNPQEYKT